jgi:hypothetical protein
MVDLAFLHHALVNKKMMIVKKNGYTSSITNWFYKPPLTGHCDLGWMVLSFTSLQFVYIAEKKEEPMDD